MSGLLGALGGAAKGVADRRLADIEKKEAFDYQMAMEDIRSMKALALKQRGIEMDREYEAKDRQAAQDAYDSVKKDDRGGWQSPEDAAAEEDSLDRKRQEALFKAGYGKSDLGLLTSSRIADRSKEAQAERKLAQKDFELQIKDTAAALNADIAARRISLAEATAKLAEMKAAQGPAPTQLEIVAAAKTRLGTDKERPTDKALVDLYTKDKEPQDKVTVTEDLDAEGKPIGGSRTRTSQVPAGKKPAGGAPGSWSLDGYF